MIDHERAGSGRKLGAALAAATSNHRAAGSIPHPEPEPVFLLPSAVVRLVCPFHPWPPRTPGPRWGPGAGRAAIAAVHARTSGWQSLRPGREHQQSSPFYALWGFPNDVLAHADSTR